jgi:hypothetical protein
VSSRTLGTGNATSRAITLTAEVNATGGTLTTGAANADDR